jgi:hypothetical protein
MQEEEPSISTTTNENIYPIMIGELTEAIEYSKNKKALSYDRTSIELIKYALTVLHYIFLELLNILWNVC